MNDSNEKIAGDEKVLQKEEKKADETGAHIVFPQEPEAILAELKALGLSFNEKEGVEQQRIDAQARVEHAKKKLLEAKGELRRAKGVESGLISHLNDKIRLCRKMVAVLLGMEPGGGAVQAPTVGSTLSDHVAALAQQERIGKVIGEFKPDLEEIHRQLEAGVVTAARLENYYSVLQQLVLLMNGNVSAIPDSARNAKQKPDVKPLKVQRLEAKEKRERELLELKEAEAMAARQQQEPAPEIKHGEKTKKPSKKEKKKEKENSDIVVPVNALVNPGGMTPEFQPTNPRGSEVERARVHIRWMIRRDMPEVLQIEDQSFDFAWTEEDFLRCLRQRNCIGMVAEHGEKVVGSMIYELHKSKIHIMNFAVHPQWRRLQVGSQMSAKLISKLSDHRRTRITTEVRETNLPAQSFFRKNDYRAVKVLRGYYADSGEDAFLMEYRFGAPLPDDPDEGGTNRIAGFEEN